MAKDKEKPQTRVEIAKNYSEIIGKLFLGLIALCYAIGLLVVNGHLSNYGLYSLSLFRVSYIMAGIWALLPLLVVLCLATIGWWIAAECDARKGKQRRRFLIFIVTIAIISILGLFKVFKSPSVIKLFNVSLLDWFICIITLLLFGGLIIFIWYSESLSSERRLPLVSLILIVILCAITTHALVFGSTIYGAIPAYLGGGSPINVQLIIEDDEKSKSLIQSAGIKLTQDSHLTEDINYLLSTDEEYIFIIVNEQNKKSTVSLNRDVVKAIMYEY